MDEKRILEQRIVTLTGLLDTPGGPLGPTAGALGQRLRQSWDAERRLLCRLLSDTRDGDLRATMGLWFERTSAFLRQSADDPATWTDRDGHQWDAAQVLELLADVQERLDSWQQADEAFPDDESLSEPA
jgi:hypothetical protein